MKATPPVRNYAGRKHSLWFCDAQHFNKYGWFETAFMWHPMKAETTTSRTSSEIDR